MSQADPQATRRLHRAPWTWDGTRRLPRQLAPGARGASRVNASLSAQPRVRELHPPTRSPRRRGRSIRAGAGQDDDCPLGPGRCCRLHRVRASLHELGWSEWVLSPRELQVGVCVGQCPHLHRTANTHAQIKERLHRLRPDSVPAPCCVPASYEPVVLLHKTDSGVSLQTYDDVLAKACHCV